MTDEVKPCLIVSDPKSLRAAVKGLRGELKVCFAPTYAGFSATESVEVELEEEPFTKKVLQQKTNLLEPKDFLEYNVSHEESKCCTLDKALLQSLLARKKNPVCLNWRDGKLEFVFEADGKETVALACAESTT